MMYLGVDYGKKKMGLAVSEGLGSSALDVIQINSLADAIEKTRRVIEREGIDRVVVGLPESGEARAITQKFINSLKAFIEVVVADETLSSHNASEKMIQLGKGKKARAKEDAYSAALILQGYLDNL